MKPVLVIPSAKLIPKELQGIGEIPPLLYPFGSGTLFDYLFKMYDPCVGPVRVVGFEGFDLLQARLPQGDRITLLNLDVLTDLAHTVHEGLRDGDTDVIVNFADTFIDEDVQHSPRDCFYYATAHLSSRWTFLTLDNGFLSGVVDKQESPSSAEGMLFTGVFRFSDGAYFKRCIEIAADNSEPGVSTFYSAVLRYNKLHPMAPVMTDRWYDIGHIDKYYSARMAVRAREFNHISVDRDRGVLRKTSDDVDKFIGEIKWYLTLPSEVEYCRPRIFSYSTSYTNPYVEMEFYAYHTVHELLLYGDITYDQWRSVFERIAFVMRDLSRFTVKGARIPESLKEMYLDKTISRLRLISKIPGLGKLMDNPITVNDVTYPSLCEVCDILQDVIPRRICKADEFCIIHGDLCFTNILTDDSFTFVKLIDPRGKFGRFDIYGDRRYDLAKLFHSVDGGYDYIIKDLFDLDFDEMHNTITLSFDSRRDLYGLIQEIMADMIGDMKDDIELIESLLFLSMAPLHMESKRQQLAMLATGLQILDRVCHIRRD